MDPLHFTIRAKARCKKTSQRILRFGKFNKIVPSKAYIAFQDSTVPPLRAWMAGRPAIVGPVSLAAVFYVEADRIVDAHGLYEGLADILVLAGVLVDDNRRVIRDWDGSRVLVDRKQPRIVVTITHVAEAAPQPALAI